MNKEKQIVEIGNLYDINKNIINQQQTLEQGVLNSKKEIIKNFLDKCDNYYFMLLCHDRRDYTVFHINNICNTDSFKEASKILIDECLTDRGKIKAIDLTENKDAIEIWLSIDNESFVYYLFPYDAAIIEV